MIEPTKLQNAIEHAESVLEAASSDYRADLRFNPCHIRELVDGAKRSLPNQPTADGELEKAIEHATIARDMFMPDSDGYKTINALIVTAKQLDIMKAELKQEKIWKVEDPRMLREQMRVHDVAFQNLFEQNKTLTQSLAEMTKERDELKKFNEAIVNFDLVNSLTASRAENLQLREDLAATDKWWRETVQQCVIHIHDVAKYVGQFAKVEIDRQQATIERLSTPTTTNEDKEKK